MSGDGSWSGHVTTVVDGGRQLLARYLGDPKTTLGLFVVSVIALPFALEIGLATEVLILGVFALSFNLLFGFTGLLSFGHALFFGVGAYMGGRFALDTGLPLVVVLVVVLFSAAVIAVVVGALSLQLTDVYFAIITLAFAQMFYESAPSLEVFTHGSDGFGFSRPSILGLGLVDVGDPHVFYFVVAIVSVLIVAYSYLLSGSMYGRVLRAIRENEQRTRALGVNTYRVKVSVFTIAGALGGVTGCLWAMYLYFVDPSVLYWTWSGDVIIQTLIGGMFTLFGPILGTGFVLGLEDTLFENEPGYWNIFMGTVFVIFVLFARDGIVGRVRDYLDL